MSPMRLEWAQEGEWQPRARLGGPHGRGEDFGLSLSGMVPLQLFELWSDKIYAGFVRIAHHRGTSASQGANQIPQSREGDLSWGDRDGSGGKWSDLS